MGHKVPYRLLANIGHREVGQSKGADRHIVCVEDGCGEVAQNVAGETAGE